MCAAGEVGRGEEVGEVARGADHVEQASHTEPAIGVCVRVRWCVSA